MNTLFGVSEDGFHFESFLSRFFPPEVSGSFSLPVTAGLLEDEILEVRKRLRGFNP